MFQCIQGTAHFPLDMMFCAESEAKSDLLQAVLATLQLKWQLKHTQTNFCLYRVCISYRCLHVRAKEKIKKEYRNRLHTSLYRSTDYDMMFHVLKDNET